MNRVQEILDKLHSLKGVEEAFLLDGEVMEKLRDIEDQINTSIGVDLRNEGLCECIEREYTICIIKNQQFRLPPEPTVLLVGDEDLIVGKEIFPGEKDQYKERDDVIFLSEEFVMFTDKKPKKKECFVLPPVSFPELSEMEGTSDVVSCSPSPPGDLALRKSYGLEDNPELASILVGFNLENGS